MMDLTKVASHPFNSVVCDFYKNEEGNIFMTREQIGKALEYANPNDAIDKIHTKHAERMIGVSSTSKLEVEVHNGNNSYYQTRDVWFYSQKGIFEICRHSRQPKANVFMDWVWDVVEQIMKHGRFDPEEQAIMKIEDETERKLALNVMHEKRMYQNNPTDITLEVRYNVAESKLSEYRRDKQQQKFIEDFDKVKDEVEDLKVIKSTYAYVFDQDTYEKWAESVNKALAAIAYTEYGKNLGDTYGFSIGKVKNHAYEILRYETRIGYDKLRSHKTKRLQATGMSQTEIDKHVTNIRLIYDQKDNNRRNCFESIIRRLLVDSNAKVNLKLPNNELMQADSVEIH